MSTMNLSGTTNAGHSAMRSLILIGLVLLLNMTSAQVMAQNEVEPGRFEEAECPMTLPDNVNITCGYLSVPEVHGDPNSRTIKLAVAILHSHSATPQPDPVVHLHGGPGQGDLPRIFGHLNSSYLAERDYILVDQRGVGFSEPSLTCPASDTTTVNTSAQPRSEAELIAADVAAAAACRDQLVSEGITLAAYNTRQSAADFEALRLALGYEQWNLHGHSYGVLLVQTMMREYPANIRSVTLEASMTFRMSAEEMAMFGRALNEVFQGCASDAACNAAYPHLADQFQTAVELLNAQPVMIQVQPARTSPLLEVALDGQMFASTIFLQMYSPAAIPYLPYMISQAAAGNGQVMTIPASGTVGLLRGGIDSGARLLVTCQDIEPFTPAGDATRVAQEYPYLAGVALLGSRSLDEVCETWDVPAAEPAFAEPVTSPIPMLLLHGQYDPRLTPDYAVQLAATLSNSYVYVVPGVGHEVVRHSPCARLIAAAFVSDPTQEPATDCLAEVPAPAWILPGAIYPTTAMVNLVRATLESPNLLPLLIVLLICLLIFVAGLVRAVRGRTQTTAIRWLSALVALLNLVTLLTLLALILTNLTNGILIGFGIPGGAAAVRFLPLVAGGFAIGLAVLSGQHWLSRKAGGIRGILFTAVIAAAGLFVSVWLITLGFLP